MAMPLWMIASIRILISCWPNFQHVRSRARSHGPDPRPAILTIPVDEVSQWDEQHLSPIVEMLAEGVVLTSPADMAKCWPAVWETAKAAEHWIAREREAGRFPPQNPLENIFIKGVGGKSPPGS